MIKRELEERRWNSGAPDTGWIEFEYDGELEHRRKVGGRLFQVRIVSPASGGRYALSEMRGSGNTLGPYWELIEEYCLGNFKSINRRIRNEIKKYVMIAGDLVPRSEVRAQCERAGMPVNRCRRDFFGRVE